MDNTSNNNDIISYNKTQETAEKVSACLDVAIDLLEDIQNVLGSGRPKNINVKFGDKVVAKVPVSLTAIAAIVAGLAAVVVTKLTIDIDSE